MARVFWLLLLAAVVVHSSPQHRTSRVARRAHWGGYGGYGGGYGGSYGGYGGGYGGYGGGYGGYGGGYGG
ncbi:hypothetical protein GE061_011471 [Apolygus lucorum]|uniref:Uncharacterized protein n=1 Tax=Apolygus lucorum TaxID=248454 RepID=A0A8S9XZ07_APOLU|nr:hypothetical protein GE061_011471 [Apolygus lucorum]